MIIARTLAIAAMVAGIAAWIVFLRADLVLSHYDAKAHLVVSRRIIDNITPGWQQVEERAEGGDLLAQRIRRDPAFARGMTRVCEGGGVALYRRE